MEIDEAEMDDASSHDDDDENDRALQVSVLLSFQEALLRLLSSLPLSTVRCRLFSLFPL